MIFFATNLTEPETFPTNAKPRNSVRVFWSYSVRKENPTYFYIIDIIDNKLQILQPRAQPMSWEPRGVVDECGVV
uniref:SFRICE_013839 n=1 Tax=Spodoptera frugiperda TaxID=7108 RepID=A0A2H1VS59_SPOFR